MRYVSITLVVLLVTAVGAGATLDPGRNARTLTVDGTTYDYLVYRPAGHDGATPAPLILDIHGWTSNGVQQAGLSGLQAIADREGFVIAHPSGPDNAWDAGVCCLGAERDDVGFMRALVAAIAGEIPVDLDRVYATGLSNGGAMTHRLACEAADVFAAAAPFAFPLSIEPFSACQPARPIPLQMSMGLTDVLVPYDGGLFAGAHESFAYWRSVNGCTPGEPDTVITAESGNSRCETYAGCADGVETGLCSITARSFGGAFFDGHILYLNDDWDLAEMAWDFLRRWTMPDATAPTRFAMQGTSVRKARRSPKETAPIAWTLVLNADGWSAASDGATGASGTWTGRGRSGRRRTLMAAPAALATLLGAEVSVDASPPTLSLVLNKRRTRAKVRGKVPLVDGSTLRVVLKGPSRP